MRGVISTRPRSPVSESSSSRFGSQPATAFSAAGLRFGMRGAVFQWHRVQSGDLAFGKDYSAALHRLFARTLGIDYPFEAIPESGACYWIPFVNVSFSRAAGSRGTGETSKEAPCSAPVADRAAVFRVGRLAFVFNSQVNWRKDQRFSFRLSELHCSGVLGLNGWMEAKEGNPGEVQLWFYARRGARIVLDFHSAVFWKPAGGVAANWSAAPVTRQEFITGRGPDEILVRRAGE